MVKSTYDNAKTLIAAGRYEYAYTLSLLGIFAMVGSITPDEYIELTGMMAPPEETTEQETPAENEEV